MARATLAASISHDSSAGSAAKARPELETEEALQRASELRESADAARAAAQRPASAPSEEIDPQLVGEVLDALRRLVGQLRTGASVRRFDAGSLRLFSTELLDVLGTESAEAAA